MEVSEEKQQDTVDVSSLSDAELATRLSEAATPKSEEDKELPVEAKEEVKDVPKTEEPAEKKESTKKEEPSATVPDEQMSISKSEWEKVQNKLKGQESLLGRQSNEIGTLRAANRTHMEKLRAELDENPLDDPINISRKVDEFKQAEQYDNDLNLQETAIRNKETVMRFAPDIEKSMDGIIEILTEDGIRKDVIEQFKMNPYAENPSTLINLAKRVELKRESESLRLENENLKKGKVEAEKNVLDKVTAAMKDNKTLTANSGQANNARPAISEKQIATMSDEEIKNFLAQADK